MEKKKRKLTPEQKQALNRAIEEYYGVKLKPWTEEDEAQAKELGRLWEELLQKEKQSSKPESGDTPTD